MDSLRQVAKRSRLFRVFFFFALKCGYDKDLFHGYSENLGTVWEGQQTLHGVCGEYCCYCYSIGIFLAFAFQL